MVTAVASVKSIANDKRLAGGVLHRTPSSAIVRSPSGAREQIHYHLSASSRNLLRAATIRNRHLPNGRHPRIRECAELWPPLEPNGSAKSVSLEDIRDSCPAISRCESKGSEVRPCWRCDARGSRAWA